jgi:hypothetical protein
MLCGLLEYGPPTPYNGQRALIWSLRAVDAGNPFDSPVPSTGRGRRGPRRCLSYCRINPGCFRAWALIIPRACQTQSCNRPRTWACTIAGIVHAFLCPHCGGHKYKLDARQLGLVEGTQDSRVAGMRHTGYPSAKGTGGPAASSRHTRFSRLQYLRLLGGYALSPRPTAAHYCPEWESHPCTQNTARPSKLLDELPWVGV